MNDINEMIEVTAVKAHRYSNADQKTLFIERGSRVFLSSKHHGVAKESLAPGFYMVSAAPDIGFYLQKSPAFELPPRIYGTVLKMANRVLTTFADRPSTTGALLWGTKGAGKSLLLKAIACMGVELGLPVVLTDNPYNGEAFNAFVRKIDQAAILLFDEFEKVYREEAHQEALLTLFDGAFSSKKLMIITSNDKWKIDKNFLNRPGRIFYAMEFGALESTFIREYLEENLKDKEKMDSVIRLGSMVFNFSFDMLQAITEELNRYGEDLKDALEILNIAYIKTNAVYNIEVYNKDGVRLGEDWKKTDPHDILDYAALEAEMAEADAKPTPHIHEDYFPKQVNNLISDGKATITLYTLRNSRRTAVRGNLKVDLNNPKNVQISGDDMGEIVALVDGYRVVFVKQVSTRFDYRTWL